MKQRKGIRNNRTNRWEIKKGTASNGKRIREAVLFLFGLTLLCLIFYVREQLAQKQTGATEYRIIKESLAGREEIPLEKYLIGVIAVNITPEFKEESGKALAILLRTNVLKLAKESGNEMISYDALGQTMLSMEELYELWGDDFEENYEKLERIVEDTEDQFLYYEGIPVEFPYFEVSAGKTRTVGNTGENEGYSYLQSISCQEDVFAENYKQQLVYTEKELKEKLGKIFETEEKILWNTMKFKKDASGYLISARWNTTEVSGEYFRKKLLLPSGCFAIKQEGKKFVFTTKGVGHGFGMSLHTANEMAKNGSDCREILSYFFPSCEIVKN